MSFSGVPLNTYVLQISKVFAVGRGWWLVLVGEGGVSKGGWRLHFRSGVLGLPLPLFIVWEKSLNSMPPAVGAALEE